MLASLHYTPSNRSLFSHSKPAAGDVGLVFCGVVLDGNGVVLVARSAQQGVMARHASRAGDTAASVVRRLQRPP
eukprot:m.20664 g.20664  ORF g.20664 m.20664 type:complete len:74 (-) comp6227_c1_seq1:722-943(-)